MSRFAKVTSIDAVERLTIALATFKEEATVSLDNLELEIRRALRWLQHDQKQYWSDQVRRGWNQVTQARADLEHAMTFRGTSDYRPSCREEKMAVEKAKRRLRRAEEKVETVRHWCREVDNELIEYQGSINQLAGWLQADCPRAIAALKRMSDALESYLAVQTPADTAAASRGRSSPGHDDVEPASQPPGDRSERTPSGSSDDENMGSAHGGLEPGRSDGSPAGGEDRNDEPMG